MSCGDAVQSMTTTKTADVEGHAPADLRARRRRRGHRALHLQRAEAAEGLAHIVPRSPVPIVADIHFHVEMALAALEAGVQGCGSTRQPAQARGDQARRLRGQGPRRADPHRGQCRLAAPRPLQALRRATPEALVESARMEIAYFDEVDFHDVKISVKASNVPLMIEAYRLASETFDHPLHLGVTEAGPPPAGLLKGTAGIATLLAEGIGDTIRYSLTADPVEEARAGRQLLEALGLRERKGLDLIACPRAGAPRSTSSRWPRPPRTRSRR
jgi:(E)-4-hydroxy-3-methylbut-2-enyl-diphosphate synthase